MDKLKRSEVARLREVNRELVEALTLLLRGCERVKQECPKQWATIRHNAEHAMEDLGQGMYDARAALARAEAHQEPPQGGVSVDEAIQRS